MDSSWNVQPGDVLSRVPVDSRSAPKDITSRRKPLAHGECVLLFPCVGLRALGGSNHTDLK